MPNCCLVPNCKSNYPGSKNAYTVFSLPKDAELAKIWLKQICRENVSELQTIQRRSTFDHRYTAT